MHLEFPPAGLDRIHLTRSNLSRPKEYFIHAKVRTMLVEECLLKFDNEKAFVVESEHFDFLNNELEKIDTDAIEVKASRTIRIVGNIFDHAQEKVFVDILPTFETTLVEFVNNTFHQFEDGFLKLPTSLSSSFGKLHFSNLVLQVRYDAKNVKMKVKFDANNVKTKVKVKDNAINAMQCQNET